MGLQICGSLAEYFIMELCITNWKVLYLLVCCIPILPHSVSLSLYHLHNIIWAHFFEATAKQTLIIYVCKNFNQLIVKKIMFC